VKDFAESRLLEPSAPAQGALGLAEAGENQLNFQVKDQTYFLDLSEEEAGQWLVFVETPTGTRPIPVYVDASPSDEFPVLVEDKKRRHIVN
jgi:hypothetical protein